MIGETIEDYRIIDDLGQGSMGQVFRAVDLMLDREVAIKVFHLHLIHDRSILQLFRGEAVTQAKLFHPNIALLYDFFEHQGSYLLVTEYIKGESFESILKR